tara:strand:- start:375 stop:1304 length:930 start_codon:yes stop_codon:yes gene_type:complete
MSANTYGLIRIIGNAIPRLHNPFELYKNLLYIIKNEEKFPNCKKVWILNRIADFTQKQLYIDLLEEYDYKYIDIPLVKTEYNSLIKTSFKQRDAYNICKQLNIYDPKFISLQKSLYYQNLYVCNNNGSRNLALEYGKQNFTWSFVLDGNSFFLKDDWKNIVQNIERYEDNPNNEELQYVIIPMVRTSSNNDIKTGKINKLLYSEPQIGFKNSSDAIFNNKIPYGASPKAELLRVLSIPGPWNKWIDNITTFNIPDRPKITVPYITVSKVIRLYTGGTFKIESRSEGNVRYILRVLGLHILCSILDKQTF